ncbi:hypothetical protein [Escherichia coli]|nr:hypothetical protein [Escherichia coli]
MNNFKNFTLYTPEKPDVPGAMCFMLFVWLGTVVTLCAMAAVMMQ